MYMLLRKDGSQLTTKGYADAAVQWAIDLAAEQGLKYRYFDFGSHHTELPELNRNSNSRNSVSFIGGATPKGVRIVLSTDCPRMGKRVKEVKDNFLNFAFCRVIPTGYFAGVNFFFSFNEIEIHVAGDVKADEDKVDTIIKKVQKLLALADPSRNPSEEEALAASMQAQKLLAKYNLDIAAVTGKEKEEKIEQTIADVGTGKKWKYNLADVIARSYCCKAYFVGSDQIVFYGYQSDTVIAQRVFLYLFAVGNRLGDKYVKDYKAKRGYVTPNLFNTYVNGFTDGINAELSKQCTALALIVPPKVEESYTVFSVGFGTKNTQIETNPYDRKAYEQGKTDGRHALNARYLEKGKE